MKRISFFVHDLASNPIVRAAALASAVSRDWEVEILGFLHSGDTVYAPYRDRFVYKTLRVHLETNHVMRALPELARMATGDVIYACKPLLTTFGAALLHARITHRKPLFLDVEDDEWVAPSRNTADFVWRHVIKGWRHAIAWKYTRALHPFVKLVNGISVSTRVLQKRYGGAIVRHGPDEEVFNADAPRLRDPNACRLRWGLPVGVPVALFAGMPQPHKGWNVLLDALNRPHAAGWHLALAGPADHPEFEEARRVLGRRCHILGLVAYDEMASVLGAVDAVPVPQLDVPFAHAQLPAKVLDAMAMARPVITTSIGDLPDILGNGARGFLVPPGDPTALALALESIAIDPDSARRRGAAARQWFLEEASGREMARRLAVLLSSTPSPLGARAAA